MMNTRRFAVNALLAAMCAVLGAVSLDMGNLKITFECLPVLLGALLFGPVDGLAIGGVGVTLYQLLRYGVSVTTLLWILPYLACGLLAGWYAQKHGFVLSARQRTFIVFLSSFLVFALNTLAMYVDSKVFGYYSFVYIFGATLPRLAVCVGKSAAYSAVLPTLMRAVTMAQRRQP